MEDGSTLDTRRPRTPLRRLGQPTLTFTLLYHPDPGRIGEQAIVPCPRGGTVDLSRIEPLFAADDRMPCALQVRGVSRAPLRFSPMGGGAWRVHPERATLSYTVDGGRGIRLLTPDQLKHGCVVSLGGWVMLSVREGAHPVQARDRLGFVGASPQLESLREEVAQLADSELPVLIRAETGCGKELVATALHAQSPRCDRPFLTFNIAAVHSSAAVSQLFGHVRGAFTGAAGTHDGYFAQAHTGTLFIDEIGEAEDALQPLLLRALDQREIQPLGGKTREVDVRLVFATDADLEHQVREGTLRRALFHRLDQVTVSIPPLRDRPEDIVTQAVHFLRESLGPDSPELRANSGWLTPELVQQLLVQPWDGNTRELRARMAEIALRSRGKPYAQWPRTATAPPPTFTRSASTHRPSEPIDEHAVRAALAEERFRIGPAAKRLGLAKNTLYARMAEYGIPRPRDLDLPTLRRALEAHNGDLDAAARTLQVSARGLKLRLRELEQ